MKTMRMEAKGKSCNVLKQTMDRVKKNNEKLLSKPAVSFDEKFQFI